MYPEAVLQGRSFLRRDSMSSWRTKKNMVIAMCPVHRIENIAHKVQYMVSRIF
jgi:hypothetical protein